MSVLLEQPASLVAYRPNKPTAMVVVADPRVRSTVTRHLWALGVRDVIEASSVAEARPRIGNPRDICVAEVHLPAEPEDAEHRVVEPRTRLQVGAVDPEVVDHGPTVPATTDKNGPSETAGP